MSMVFVIPVILTIVISALIVKIAAVALNLTGMDEKTSFFQALSAYTGTGFTTQDSEMVVNDDVRRKIVIFLMITGNAGLISVITSLILSFKGGGATFVAANLVIIVLAILALILISKNKRIVGFLTSSIKDKLSKTTTFTKRPVEEIFRLAKGYGIAEVILEEHCEEIGKTLSQSSLRKHDILILAIERGNNVIPTPHADDRLMLGDTIICYGNLENIARIIR